MKDFLRSERKAYRFEDCYPLGNGTIGVMDNGGPIKSTIVLNDEGLWSGNQEEKKGNKCGREGLREIRKAMENRQFAFAESLIKEKIAGLEGESYIPIGELTIDKGWGSYRKYQRILDLERAILSTSYILSDKEYREESFVSYPDRVYVKTIESNQKSIFRIRFMSSHPYACIYENGIFTVSGRAPSHIVYHDIPASKSILYDKEIPGQIFTIAIKVDTDAEQIYYSNGTIRVANATYMTLFYTSLTEMGLREQTRLSREASSDTTMDQGDCATLNSETIEEISLKQVIDIVNKASEKGHLGCLMDHIADYKELYERLSFEINEVKRSPDNIDKAIKKQGPKDALIVTFYNFTRYLMISSSRETSLLPSNLQGLWSRSKRPLWSSGYTMNINFQMNYWPAMPANLSECASPFFRFVKNLSLSGQKTAKDLFEMPGFVLGHNSDGSYHSSPVGGETKRSSSSYSLSMSTSGWLINQMFDMYSYSMDKELLLDTIIPEAELAIQFYLEYLYENNKGEICCGPDISPENSYIYKGDKFSVDEAPAITMAVIRELFNNYIEYGKDPDILEKVKKLRESIPKYRITEKGTIAEWSSDYEESNKDHRHLSHLYGLYPGKEIYGNSILEKAVQKSLESRGDGGTGWSLAWKICLYARLGMGNKAYQLLQKQFRPVHAKRGEKGGCYLSLLSAHPPFQVDGNFGTLAGINEMIYQALSDKGLEALPSNWRSGKVTGLRIPGNKQVDFEWKDGAIIKKQIKDMPKSHNLSK